MDKGAAVVTGCSRGIGLALAGELASGGWTVFAGVRDPSTCTALDQMVQRAGVPGTIRIVPLDVTSDESVREAVSVVSGHVRAVDVLVNNAGVFPEVGNEELEKLPLRFFEEAFAVNVVGVARVTRSFLPLLGRAGHPRVVNISSRAGSVGSKEDHSHYAYSASKAALNMLTRTMAAELRLRGITVVAVTPGWVKTEMGGPSATITVAESARSLAATIDRLTAGDAGEFLDRDGRRGEVAW